MKNVVAVLGLVVSITAWWGFIDAGDWVGVAAAVVCCVYFASVFDDDD